MTSQTLVGRNLTAPRFHGFVLEIVLEMTHIFKNAI